MAFLVETGTGIANANSYITELMLEEYAEDRGVILPTSGNVEAAMVRATAYIDSYRARFPGYRTFGRAQGLEWPRNGAFYPTQNTGLNFNYDQYGYATSYHSQTVDYILPNVIPIEIIRATAEATIRELNKPNTLMPDNVIETSGGGALKKISAGDTSKEYAVGVLATRSSVPFPLIDDILSVLLMTTGSFGVAIRG